MSGGTCYFPATGILDGAFVRERRVDYGPERVERRIDTVLLASIQDVSMARARVVEAEAALIARIHETKAHEKLGFHFGDLAREVLHMDPRTARNRLALHRVISAWSAVRKAFLSGEVSACQALVI